ncbi:methyl-accepting chemotaxis protein [Massilia brevitalea]|uniref:methyl-accepting chemotaxis protein n=1 Tax=Massilia brevitalea TaxID=442526 RepID=UPI0027397718|nr:methyl-accepting chemotaxis protein [Massilia brevitalea]
MKFFQARLAVRLYTAFAAVLVVTLILAGFAISRVNSIETALVEVESFHSAQLEPLYAAREALGQTGIAARNAFIFHDAAQATRELDILDTQKAAYLAAMSRLDPVLGGNAQYGKVKEGMLAMARELERPRKYRTSGDMEGYGTFLVQECSPLRRQIVADIGLLVQELQGQTNQAGAAAVAEADGARYWISGLAVLCALLCAVIGFTISRNLLDQLGGEPAYATDVARAIAQGQLHQQVDTRRALPSSLLSAMSAMRDSLSGIVAKVRGGTDAIASASAEIATGNLDLSARTESQAAALAQIAGSMKQLIGSVRQNADYAAQASTLAGEASKVSVEGGATVDGVVSTMNLIQESSRKIEEIISVIDSIAFQTNILALNAAVEAARAGEQGRGFAVVASEVRNLAHRSAAAAKEIKVLIEDSVSKVGAGTALVAQAGETMRKVVSGVQRVNDIMGQISSATRSQSEDIEHVDSAIVRLDEMTLQNAALVEEASAAAQSLRMQADELAAVVNTFQLESGEAATGIEPPRRVRQPVPALAG